MPQHARKHRDEERTYPSQSPKAAEKEATEALAQGWETNWFVTSSLQVTLRLTDGQ